MADQTLIASLVEQAFIYVAEAIDLAALKAHMRESLDAIKAAAEADPEPLPEAVEPEHAP